MRHLIWLSFTFLLFTGLVYSQEARTTYDAVIKGMTCKSQRGTGQLDCEYKVGHDLNFILVGIGEPDAAFTVFKADFDGDYYVTFPIEKSSTHHCAIVKPGKKSSATVKRALDMAFVSPVSGHVFKTWRECTVVK